MYLTINLIITENFILCSLPMKEHPQQITPQQDVVIWRTKAKRNVIKTSSVEKTVKTVFYYVCSYISHSFLFAMKKKKLKALI